MEVILNVGESGKEKINAGRAFQMDANGMPIITKPKNNTSHYGHHMLNAAKYAEYVGVYI